MNKNRFKSLKTERLNLRRLYLKDTKQYFKVIGSSDKVSKYTLWEPHKNIDETEMLMREWVSQYNDNNFYKWAIVLKTTGELIGIIQLLRFDIQNNSCEVAYLLGENYWNHGYMTEALNEVLNFSFTELGLSFINADHYSENIASGKVLLKAGMKFIGKEKDRFNNNKGFDELMCYSIKYEDWKQYHDDKK